MNGPVQFFLTPLRGEYLSLSTLNPPKKTVDDLECSPVSYEDCKNTVVDDPYLEEEEQCEDVEFDECVDVEEQVPIQVCKVVDPDRTPVINREIEGSRKRTGGRRTGNTSRPVRRK